MCCLVSDTVCSSGYILRRIACLMNGTLDRMWLNTVTVLFAQRDRVQSRGFAQTAPAPPLTRRTSVLQIFVHVSSMRRHKFGATERRSSCLTKQRKVG